MLRIRFHDSTQDPIISAAAHNLRTYQVNGHPITYLMDIPAALSDFMESETRKWELGNGNIISDSSKGQKFSFGS